MFYKFLAIVRFLWKDLQQQNAWTLLLCSQHLDEVIKVLNIDYTIQIGLAARYSSLAEATCALLHPLKNCQDPANYLSWLEMTWTQKWSPGHTRE